MALELRQQLKLTQQLIMTPQLQMAIKLLQLSRLELMDTIRQELEENPALEEVSETAESSSAEKEETAAQEKSASEEIQEVKIEEKLPEDVDWSNYLDEFNAPSRANFEYERRDTPSFETFLSRKESLHDHLLWQLLVAGLDETEQKIGSYLVGNTNSDGYLDVGLDELAETAEVEIEQVNKVLAVIQTFDPVGVCARDLRECLMIQANHLCLENTLVTEIINRHLNYLENKNFKALCRVLKANTEEVLTAVNIIQGLEPRPGRLYAEDEAYHITPDIYVQKLDGEFVIILNDSGMPRLRVNSYYKQAFRKDNTITPAAKEYLNEKMRSATWLIRSIHQRQKTIYKVMESILKFQRNFFDKGIAHLKPLVLRNVAEDIGMHESTISRVTTNKYVHTPQGIFELKYFFNSSINRIHGESIASASVQDKIRQIIDNENNQKPYSDNQIAKMLAQTNIQIARRTVAKYREAMRILPSSKRKQF
jgi:RNA polymerase sigma-54 factor